MQVANIIFEVPENKISIFQRLSESLTFIPYCQNSKANRISSVTYLKKLRTMSYGTIVKIMLVT